MARIVNPAGVPANPVIDGNITAITAVTNDQSENAHLISATTDYTDGKTELWVGGDWSETVYMTDKNDVSSPRAGLYVGGSDTDVSVSLNTNLYILPNTGTVIQGDSLSATQTSEAWIGAYGANGAQVKIESVSGNDTPSDINMIGNISVTGSLAINTRNIDPKTSMYLFDDMAQGITALTASSSSTGDAGIVSPPVTASGAIGIQGQKTGTGSLNRNTTSCLPGNGVYGTGRGYELVGETRIKLPNLSNGTEGYYIVIGFGTANDGNAPTTNQRAVFVYQNNGGSFVAGNTAYWQTQTSSSGTTTANNITEQIAVTTDWTNLKIVINSLSSTVKFYINDLLIGTHDSGIFTSDTPVQWYSTIRKTIGSTNRELWTDYFSVACNFPTPRE